MHGETPHHPLSCNTELKQAQDPRNRCQSRRRSGKGKSYRSIDRSSPCYALHRFPLVGSFKGERRRDKDMRHCHAHEHTHQGKEGRKLCGAGKLASPDAMTQDKAKACTSDNFKMPTARLPPACAPQIKQLEPSVPIIRSRTMLLNV
jgi:hypothetical protein